MSNSPLKSYVDRFASLLEEAAANAADQRELAKEIKGEGFKAATVKRLAQLRIDDKKARAEKAKNEELALYNRETDAGLDLGLDTVAEIQGDARDERAIRAAELLREGLSIRKVAADTGMSHGSVQRLKAALREGVPNQGVPAVPTGIGTPESSTAADAPAAEVSPAAVAAPAPAVVETVTESAAGASTREDEGSGGPNVVMATTVPGLSSLAADTVAEYQPRIAPLAVVKPAELDAGPIPAFMDRRLTPRVA